MSCPRQREDTPLTRSVKDRLHNQARAQKRLFNDLLQQYIIERFLYRLSISRYRNRFVLKGALMFVALGGAPLRPTRDIDLLGRGPNQPEPIRLIMQEICALPGEDKDGVWFDPESVTVSRIIEHATYHGLRVRLVAYLGKACVPLQVDVGFGDVLTVQPLKMNFPSTLAGLPAPEIVGYPIEAIIAEKVETMIRRGSANSRMKDFYDVWVLLQKGVRCTPSLAQALETTLRHRGTSIPESVPVAWTADFAAQKGRAWQAFLRRSRLPSLPLPEVVQQLESILWPCFQRLHKGSAGTR